MILTVSSDQFVEVVGSYSQRATSPKIVFYYRFNSPGGGTGYRLTYCAPEMNLSIITDMLVAGRGVFSLMGATSQSGDEAFDALVNACITRGMQMMPGLWTHEFEGIMHSSSRAQASQESSSASGSVPEFFIAAAAYVTAEGDADIWTQAFPIRPTEQQALKAMYDFFVESGDLEDVAFQEFVSAARPVVEILSTSDFLETEENPNV